MRKKSVETHTKLERILPQNCPYGNSATFTMWWGCESDIGFWTRSTGFKLPRPVQRQHPHPNSHPQIPGTSTVRTIFWSSSSATMASLVAACTACWCRCARVRSCSEGAHSDVDGAGALERFRLLERERCGGSLGGASSDEVTLQAMKASCISPGCDQNQFDKNSRLQRLQCDRSCWTAERRVYQGEVLHTKILSFQR